MIIPVRCFTCGKVSPFFYFDDSFIFEANLIVFIGCNISLFMIKVLSFMILIRWLETNGTHTLIFSRLITPKGNPFCIPSLILLCEKKKSVCLWPKARCSVVYISSWIFIPLCVKLQDDFYVLKLTFWWVANYLLFFFLVVEYAGMLLMRLV